MEIITCTIHGPRFERLKAANGRYVDDNSLFDIVTAETPEEHCIQQDDTGQIQIPVLPKLLRIVQLCGQFGDITQAGCIVDQQSLLKIQFPNPHFLQDPVEASIHGVIILLTEVHFEHFDSDVRAVLLNGGGCDSKTFQTASN